MTKVVFKNNPLGFCISDHATTDSSDKLGAIVCSAVSSAAYMAANTITDIIGDKAEITVKDAEMSLYVANPSSETVAVLKGLKLHLQSLSKQYTKNISFNSEV